MILACAGCDSRYDVTGHPVGQQFRCRCGVVTALQAPSRQAGLLGCPHCGAGVSPTSRTCDHCQHALLLKACPRCLSRVFHGHKHCPECGTELSVAATVEPSQDRQCPRCDEPLGPRRIDDIVVDECIACHGLFIDQVAIQRIVTDRRQARAESLLGALPSTFNYERPPAGKMYIKCPICRVVMNRKLFAAGSGVVIDVCKSHGTFFDTGELPRIIEYVMQGGLEKAAAQRIDRDRAQAQREQHAARAASAEVAHGRGATQTAQGTAFVDLLLSIFR
ncbi:MAG: zf-TFIIB domain-containing protein [Myxococcota bacterium]|nr:zf-TFIIB domain-containing protein [Myxococcota bacterium]